MYYKVTVSPEVVNTEPLALGRETQAYFRLPRVTGLTLGSRESLVITFIIESIHNCFRYVTP